LIKDSGFFWILNSFSDFQDFWILGFSDAWTLGFSLDFHSFFSQLFFG